MPLGTPDEELARRAATDDAAFDELVHRHRGRVYAITLRLCRNPDDAEDALQDTFIKAYRALGHFDGRAQFSTWIHRIAVNASYDVISKRRETVSLDSVAEPAAPVDPFEASDRRARLIAAVDALPDLFREAAVLCDIAGLTPAEAGELTGTPEGTMKSRSHRARALLVRELREPDEAG